MAVRSWTEAYRRKRLSVEEAVGRIRCGQRVFIGTACAEPQTLVRELIRQAPRLADVEIIRPFDKGSCPMIRIAEASRGECFTLRSFFMGSLEGRRFHENKRFWAPFPLSAFPRLFQKHLLPLQIAFIQVSPPDDQGRMCLGISVDVTLAAAQAAEMVIAQVNPRMPRVGGKGFIHVDEVDGLVEQEEALLTVKPPPDREEARAIGQQAAALIENGATLQLGGGIVPHAALWALKEKRDLGIHTFYLHDDFMHLFRQGVITNRKKNIHPGKSVACGAAGSQALYAFLNGNPDVEFHPADCVCDPVQIARHYRMMTVNGASAVDLTGQVRIEALPSSGYWGILEILDFIRGATAAKEGRSLFLLPATDKGGEKSRIVASLKKTQAVVPSEDVHFVITEFGTADLLGKTLEERALALIHIAHPRFRHSLWEEAKTLGLLGKERVYPSSFHRVYPREMEEERTIAGQRVRFRPVKPSDERLIQEHFYHMDPEDVASRFFHEKTLFPRRELSGIIQVDFETALTLVAVIGPPGFEQVIGVGGYFPLGSRNAVEAAFSVLKPWQQKGIGTVLLRKLAAAAEARGFSAFLVYTQPRNRGMIRLFQKMPHPVTATYEEDLLLLCCRLDEEP